MEQEKLEIKEDFCYPIDKSIIPLKFLDKFKVENIEFKVDEIEEMILKDIQQFDENTRIKLNRNVTSTFLKWIDNKIEKKENASVNVKGSTRCSPYYNKILMSNLSLKQIKDVKIGDEVLSVNLSTKQIEPNIVTEVFNNGEKYVNKIKLKTGFELEITKGHKIYCLEKIGYSQKLMKTLYSEPKYKLFEELKVGDYLAIPNHINFEKKTNISLNELNLIGFYLGDGYIKRDKNYNVVSFDLSKQDKINYLTNLVNNTNLNYSFSRFEYERKNNNWLNGNKFQFKKKNMLIKKPDDFTKLIFDLGLKDCRAKDKFIPEIIKQATHKELYFFLSGLFSSDGSCDKTKGLIYHTTSKQLFDDLLIILTKLNINFVIKKKEYKNHYNTSYKVIIQHKKDLIKLYNNCDFREDIKNNLKILISNKKDTNRTIYKIIGDLKFIQITDIEYNIKKVLTYDLTISNNHNYFSENILISNSGKSLITLKLTERITRKYNKPFNTLKIVCGNQKEYRQKLQKANFGDPYQIDENAFTNVGDGSMTEVQQLKDIQNIIAKENIHTFYITPRTFLPTGALVGLAYFGKDSKNWLSRFLLYSLQGANPILLGYVVINVGDLFNDYGCFFNREFGGCTNPNKLKLKQITKDKLVFDKIHEGKIISEKELEIDYLKYSSCIPEEFKQNPSLDKLNLKEIDMEKVPCPFYRICEHPLCKYEHKKDTWISKEMAGGMDERQEERFRVAIDLIKQIGYYDEENNRFMLRARNGKDLMVKANLFIPKITNTKFTKTEKEEVISIIQSLSDYMVFEETIKQLKLDMIKTLQEIDGTENLIEMIKENNKKEDKKK